MNQLLHSKIQDYLNTNPPGWCWIEKAVSLADSVLFSNSQLVIEIGVFGGRSFIPLALALQHQNSGFAFGIDPWLKSASIESCDPATDSAHIDYWSKLNYDWILTQAWDALTSRGLDSRCGLLRMHSELASNLFRPDQIDLLHIDGCHTTDIALRDVQTWLPLCRPGAFIWFDDTNWASTQRAVVELESRCQRLQTLTSPDGGETRLYQKRG